MTTPTKKPFDAKSHRWGMAYVDSETLQTVWPYSVIGQAASCLTYDIEPGCAGLFRTVRFTNSLVKSPEHDLIPRSDVDALIEAATKLIGTDDEEIASTDNLSDWFILKEALSAFQSKYPITNKGD